jgi:hypothetical protein
MKRFELSTPRAANVVAALAMIPITFSLAIVVTATLDANSNADGAQATNAVSSGGIEHVVVAAGVDLRRPG